MKERYSCSYVTGVAVARDVPGAHVDAHVDGRLEGHAKGVGRPRRLVESVTLSLRAQRQLGLSQTVRSATAYTEQKHQRNVDAHSHKQLTTQSHTLYLVYRDHCFANSAKEKTFVTSR